MLREKTVLDLVDRALWAALVIGAFAAAAGMGLIGAYIVGRAALGLTPIEDWSEAPPWLPWTLSVSMLVLAALTVRVVRRDLLPLPRRHARVRPALFLVLETLLLGTSIVCLVQAVRGSPALLPDGALGRAGLALLGVAGLVGWRALGRRWPSRTGLVPRDTREEG